MIYVKSWRHDLWLPFPVSDALCFFQDIQQDGYQALNTCACTTPNPDTIGAATQQDGDGRETRAIRAHGVTPESIKPRVDKKQSSDRAGRH